MADKVPLPKGLVDISDFHCPVIEPTHFKAPYNGEIVGTRLKLPDDSYIDYPQYTTFGLPYHGLVINGKLKLPNGKEIDYPQPKALAHKTVTYFNKGNYWCTNDGGFYAPSGYVICNYERKYLGGTVLVRGKGDIPIIKRTSKEKIEDYKNGYQWKNYAYLCGTRRALAGNELEPGVLNDFGDGLDGKNTLGYYNKEVSSIAKSYNVGHWLYNDGSVTWLMKWIVDPSTTNVYFIGQEKFLDPIRTLTLWVVKPLGLFGASPEINNMSPVKIYEGPYDIFKDRYSNNGSPVWLPYYSADGSKISINEMWNWFTTYCGDSYLRYWMAQYVVQQHVYFPEMCDSDATTGQWTSDLGELWTWAEIDISGKGSLTKGKFGTGIIADVNIKLYGRDWYPPGAGSYDYWGCGICAVVTPDGDRGYWWTSSNPDSGSGNVLSSWGDSIPFHFYSSHDWAGCHSGLQAPGKYVYQGAYLYDDGLFIICYGSSGNVKDFTTVHLQGRSYKKGGISYDIANDEWSTIENSCYV